MDDWTNVSDDVKELNPEFFVDGAQPKRNKFGAVKTVIDGIKFDSKGEANRYLELKELQEKGTVSELELQPKFILLSGFEHGGKKYRPITYTADFMYKVHGQRVVEDFKGFETEVFKIKRKLFLKNNPRIKFVISRK